MKPSEAHGAARPEPATPESIRSVLKAVTDPELGVNIVDLGLVYDVAVHDKTVNITMTMTSAACPMEELLTSSVEAAVLQSFPEVRAADVELTWDPAWSEARMSDAARAQLGWTSR